MNVLVTLMKETLLEFDTMDNEFLHTFMHCILSLCGKIKGILGLSPSFNSSMKRNPTKIASQKLSPPVKHRYNTRAKTQMMEDQIRELSEKMEEMQAVAETVQEMKQQMAKLMRFLKTGKMVEGESLVGDPQFP